MTTMPVPSKLLTTLGALNVGSFVPNPFNYMLPTNETSQRPPDYAQRYEVDSSLFLLNTGLMMSTALVLLLGFIPIYLLSKLSSGLLNQYLQRLLPSFKWGIPLRWWIQSYLDISIYSLLQIQQVLTNNGLSAVAVSLNFIISLVLACFALITPIIFYVFIWKNYAKMTQRDDQTFNKRWGVLYQEFSQARSIDGLLYYPLFLTRRLTYALTIVFLYNFPKAQAVINISMALAVPFKQTFLYVLVCRPHPERLDQLGAIIGEGSTLSVFGFSCCFFLSLSSSSMRKIEDIAVWTVLGAIGANAMLSAFMSILTLHSVYKEYKRSVQTGSIVTSITTYATGPNTHSKQTILPDELNKDE